jgi:hypothetical protein
LRGKCELQSRRIEVYDGNKGARIVPELLSVHVVTAKPQAIFPVRFFSDIGAPDAQAATRMKLRELAHAVSSSPP